MRANIHFYSADTADRQNVHVYLAFIAILISYGIILFIRWLGIDVLWWIEIPSPFGVYGLLYLLFKHVLWRTRFFKFVFRLKTPNWNGTYTCDLQTSYDNFSSNKQVIVTILQNWDEISIILISDHSSSSSTSGSFAIDKKLTPLFTYEYHNIPKVIAPNTMNSHFGMANMTFHSGKLNGEFFTGRGRTTYGRFAQQ